MIDLADKDLRAKLENAIRMNHASIADHKSASDNLATQLHNIKTSMGICDKENEDLQKRLGEAELELRNLTYDFDNLKADHDRISAELESFNMPKRRLQLNGEPEPEKPKDIEVPF